MASLPLKMLLVIFGSAYLASAAQPAVHPRPVFHDETRGGRRSGRTDAGRQAALAAAPATSSGASLDGPINDVRDLSTSELPFADERSRSDSQTPAPFTLTSDAELRVNMLEAFDSVSARTGSLLSSELKPWFYSVVNKDNHALSPAEQRAIDSEFELFKRKHGMATNPKESVRVPRDFAKSPAVRMHINDLLPKLRNIRDEEQQRRRE